MPSLRLAARSDTPSPEALNRWTEVEAWAARKGWPTQPLSSGPEFWQEDDWWLVADPTGGTRAIETLPELMEGLPGPLPRASYRAWWSMSDNSVVLNALVDRSVCRVLHGHPLTLSGRDSAAQRERFISWGASLRAGEPFPVEMVPPVEVLRGSWPERGSVVGGNLGALERLGQTPWRPKPRDRLLLVESLSASAALAASRVTALIGDPWWAEIAGLLVGRFTAADRESPGWIDGLLSLLPPDLPVARWPLVGHGVDGWTVPLGEQLSFL
jgi:muramoyltetrapeptide carboxypeptidase